MLTPGEPHCLLSSVTLKRDLFQAMLTPGEPHCLFFLLCPVHVNLSSFSGKSYFFILSLRRIDFFSCFNFNWCIMLKIREKLQFRPLLSRNEDFIHFCCFAVFAWYLLIICLIISCHAPLNLD